MYNDNQLLYTVVHTSAFNGLGHKELWFLIILSYALSILKYIFWSLGIKRHYHLFNSSSKCLRKENKNHSQFLTEHRQGLMKGGWIVFKSRSDLISNDQWRCFMLMVTAHIKHVTKSKQREYITIMVSLKVSWFPLLNLIFCRVWLQEKYNYRKHTNTFITSLF